VTGGLSGRACLRKSSAFFVYGFFHPAPGLTLLMLRALRTGRPVLVLSEGLRERHNTAPRRMLMRLLSSYPNGRLLAVGHGAAEDFRRLGLRWPGHAFGFCEEPLPTVPPIARGPEFRLVSVGQLVPRKGHAKIMEWLANGQWARPVELRICGEGPERSHLQREAERLSRPGLRIVLRGHLGREELAETLAWADVCVHLASYEAWGVAVQQAAEAGLPLIISPHVRSGHGILLKNGWNGHVVDDPSALAAALEPLIQDPARCAQMGSRSRELSTEWNLEAASGRLAAILRSLLTNPAR
jgi:glycosyltransferase involved in cell wall biosynthesis